MYYSHMRHILALLMLLTLTACQGGNGGQPVRVGVMQSGSTVHLAPAQNLAVLLAANPTTGFSWSLDEMDTNVLTKTSNIYKPQSQDPLIVGGGGCEEWHFTALAPGRTLLKMAYSRSWESKQPAETFELTVIVDQPK